MLRDEIALYSKLTGEDGQHVPIGKIGAFLDGYEKGIEILDKISAEIKDRSVTEPISSGESIGMEMALEIIEKYKGVSE